jgi:hypothetical protein
MSANRPRDALLERFWRDTLAAWQKSGLSVRAFCASRKLCESNFHAWRRTLQQRDRQSPHASPPPRLVPVRVLPDALIEIVLPAGLVVRVPASVDADIVAALVAALRTATC